MAGHHHHHIDPDAGDARVFWAIAVNFILTGAQIVGGIMSGSLALIADAVHNLSDAISLVIAFAARKIARRDANEQMTFGYGRAEVVAALVNYTTLVVISLYLIYEGVDRLFNPQGVDGWIVVVIAGVALVIDTVTALLTFSLSKDSVNIRAAFLHNVADALGSVGVIIAGTLIILYDWRLIDPIVTLMIAGYILWQAFAEVGPVIRTLMLGTPPEIAADAVVAGMCAVDGVSSVHHVHVWQMQEHEAAVEAHVVVAKGRWGDADAVKAAVKAMLQERFGVRHSVLELECAAHACGDVDVIGHGGEGVHVGHGHKH